ncbi:MAG: hypothetical protein ACTSVY_08850 [Candidatus Helarchaeota archaeon]
MSGGFYYTLEDEKIKKYMKLSTEEKLKWLEEINTFTELLLTKKEKEIRNRFRS